MSDSETKRVDEIWDDTEVEYLEPEEIDSVMVAVVRFPSGLKHVFYHIGKRESYSPDLAQEQLDVRIRSVIFKYVNTGTF